jgi:hypothetical protein
MPWGDFKSSGRKSWRTVGAVMLAALCVSACSAGDVEFEGKLFELAGLNNVGKGRSTPKMAERSGLVVPPDLKRLPDPNQAQAQAQGPNNDLLASIHDPDQAKVVDQAELQRRQAEACKNYELAKAQGDLDADLMQGPLGLCRKSVLNMFGADGSSLFGSNTDSK